MRGVGVSHDNEKIAGAETFSSVEGNMCGTVMRGVVALPESWATPRINGTRRNLGDLLSGRRCVSPAGPRREDEESQPTRNGQEKSDPGTVAVKPTNKARRPAARLAEPRPGPKETRASKARTGHRTGLP
jgi:hypothetical protein